MSSRRSASSPIRSPPRSELAEVLDVSSETVRRHLSELHERGLIDRKTVGARAVVWWALDTDDSTAPAAPLRRLVGLLDGEAAVTVRERSREWREAFDDEMEGRPGSGS